MAAPSEKLAQSLEILSKLQNANGAAAIRARDLSRTHRERLLANGFLQEVIKGWYIPSRPDEVKGESTAWYASFWRFCAAYLEERLARTGASRRSSLCPCTRQLDGAPGSSSCGRREPATKSRSSRMAHPCWTFAPRCLRRRHGGKGRAAYFLAANRP